MKKLLFAFIVVTVVTKVQSQITFEHNYSTPVYLVHFSHIGYKYYTLTTTLPWSGTINIYNLDHSLYQSINLPSSIPHTMSTQYQSLHVVYLSDSLFNTNISDIEFYVWWMDTISNQYHTRIYDNSGNILFSKDSVLCGVFYTPAGYKLICRDYTYNNAQNVYPVYSLPGELPCDECVNHLITLVGPNQTNSQHYVNIYPNPSNDFTTIDFKLPDGFSQGQIVISNLQGIEIRHFNVDNTFTNLILSNSDIPAGVYFYQLQVNNNVISTKKMVIIK